ncbi:MULTISPECIES: gliding motility protein GldM [Spirosoma]|uniref:Gliding motility protein GldM n=1 Tax=Spirosoma liriopis TaxID=2937440 RepID=A0ABT0HGA0_9BACT|nr:MULTISPECIES: gliding motility protein GldM [Spirosoma]MCK8491177.1 gliding motility protein GldM [Spirosoma liriopis]UHG90553.1 gliding motility protein GldM [Spirosoma oryzicola]
MAGTKETPRQKMIGMMYLVLTALLALQVTSAILEKFVLINNSLEQSTGAVSKVNQSTFDNIRATVEKSGNRATDLAIVKQADEVRKLTADVIGEVDKLKEQIIEAGGGRDEAGNIKNLSEEEKVAQLMIGTGRTGAAFKLKDQLNGYIDAVSKYAGTKYPAMALDGKDDPIASQSPDQRKKDFAELNFAQTPVPAALAVLSQKQADVRRIEGEVLDALASKVGAQDVKFDKIIAMLSMESKVVVAGTKFKGQMFLAASSSGIQPRMSLNGGAVRMQDGQGIVEFTAQGGAYDKNGLARRVLNGSIAYQTAAGLKTVPLTAEYFVAKPSYQVETGTMPPLYLGCANKLSIQSPQLGALWNPNFSADGGAVIQSGEKGKITVVPSAANLSLNISNSGSLLGTERFRVNRVPRPTLEVFVGGTRANDPRGVPVSSARSVRIQAVADPSFAAYSPDDANFRTTGATVSLVRGTKRIQAVTVPAGGGSIAGLAAEAQPGDRLVIQVDGVQRRNFRGEVSDVPMGSTLSQVSLY